MYKKRKYSREDSDDIVNADPRDPDFIKDFLHDWEQVRDRHQGQKELLDAFFVANKQYMFIRAGRKFSKTTFNIDTAWRYALTHPKSTVHIGFPTIELGTEILWDEKRLQSCDSKEDYMQKRYVKNVDNSKLKLHFVNGSHIKVLGTWTEARGRGTQPDLLIFDEIQDCRGDYIEAADSNLLAKNGRCILTGTPPKKRNHYHEWEQRIFNNRLGQIFHYTSYANDRLEHLKDWLDNKRDELIKSGKEDVWLREYMAEDCFSHADRVLPDPVFHEHEELLAKLNAIPFKNKTPLLCVGTQGKYLCIMWGVLTYTNELYIIDYQLHNSIWNQSYLQFFKDESFIQKTRFLQDTCGQKIRKLLWDPTESLKDVIYGFADSRKPPIWQERGIPLAKEMMLEKRVHFSNNVAPLGLECQNMLADETRTEFEKLYPMICTFSVMVHEYFQKERIEVVKVDIHDKYQALRDAGLPTPRKRRTPGHLFSQSEMR